MRSGHTGNTSGHLWTHHIGASKPEMILELIECFAANFEQPHELIRVIGCWSSVKVGVMGKTTPILRMTFFRAPGNDLLGVRPRLAEKGREPSGDIADMSTCKAKTDIRPAPSDRARTPIPFEPTSRSAPIRILRLAQVIDMTGLGKTKIYELQAQGRFPLSVRITAHSVGWVEQEVQAWLTGRLAERRPLPAAALRFTGSSD
jgi:prophage regulatory protein